MYLLQSQDVVEEDADYYLKNFGSLHENLDEYSDQSLIAYVCDHYGPPVSYTEVQMANKLELFIDGGGKISCLC